MVVIVTALIVSLLAPMVLGLMTNHARRQEKREDWARQDLVALQAQKAAELLLVANERVAQTAEVTNGKLDVIHTLVNSNMTAAMQSEYDATVRELAMMREVIDLKRASGVEPSVESLAAVAATDAKIIELGHQLNDRLQAST